MEYKSTANIARLHFITNQWSKQPIPEQVQQFLAAGGRWVQLRIKDLPEAEITSIALQVQALCKTHGATYIVNDRVALAKQIDADGVHLGKEDLCPTEARKILGSGKIIGVTANSRTDLERVIHFPADYIGIGPYRHTKTKQKLATPMGTEGFRNHAIWMQQQKNTLPMVGVGGIHPGDIATICGAGIQGIALSSCISHANNPADVTRQLIQQLEKHTTCYK
jgi:thiamine-phosphate pyrophosphorylase